MSYANAGVRLPFLPNGHQQGSFVPPAPIQQHHPVVDEQAKNLTGKVTLLAESRDNATYISAGGFSTIWLGRWRRGQGPSDEKLAIKAFLGSQLHHQAQTFQRRLIRETLNWHKLRHPNILPLYGICHEKIECIPDFPALISPYCANGNINDFLSTRPTTNKLRIICQISDGLAYLHANQVVHGDLKGSNILVNDSGVACICDFGRTKLATDNDYSKSLFASAHWAAPELLLHASEDQMVPVSYKSDMWAFAMVVIEILTGGRPWPGYSDLVVLRKVPLGEKPDRRRYPAVSDSYWRVLTPCWEFDPSRRPSIQTFKGWLPAP
ncbi:kinase-like protein [Rickenella mellea]|uniref:Kinase-like protein n=1 Tax=Rickenella mellea TaxID=50990 RepID=A0A4Y7Q7E4_9AGAM|nr:kinase-like protein [Rickenella mellea]